MQPVSISFSGVFWCVLCCALCVCWSDTKTCKLIFSIDIIVTNVFKIVVRIRGVRVINNETKRGNEKQEREMRLQG